MPSIVVQAHRFHYLEHAGEGVPVLLLCSTGLDSRQWNDLLPMLGKRRVICLHYLCYPMTDSWSGEEEIDSSLDYDAAEVLLLNQSGAVDIIAHSYGGFIALRLAKNHPDRIRRIAIHEPTVWGCLQHTNKDELKNEFGEVVETFFTEGLQPEEFLQDFVDYWNDIGTWKLMPEHRKQMWRNLQPKILSEVRLLCYDKTPPSYYSSIRHPILITLSKETPPHQFEACTILSSILENVRVVDVPGGHMGVITRSQVVMPHLANWIE